MLVQSDFYLLTDKAESGRRHFVCRLIYKLYQLEQPLFLQTASESDSMLFDELLWTFNDTSFIPHAVNNTSDSAVSITLSHETCATEANLIINASDKPIPDPKTPRILEIVLNTEASKQAARQRYKNYQHQKITLNTHQIH